MIEHKPADFSNLRGLQGLSDALVQNHLRLYEGYVKNLNLLNVRLVENKPGTPEWFELKRRVGFETNGMRLHELYFRNLAPGGRGTPTPAPGLIEEFKAMGTMRGVGWVILYRDPETRALANFWIGLHEEGHPAGFTPLLVMDVWEHAFAGLERSKYVELFFSNVDWTEVNRRLEGGNR